MRKLHFPSNKGKKKKTHSVDYYSAFNDSFGRGDCFDFKKLKQNITPTIHMIVLYPSDHRAATAD